MPVTLAKVTFPSVSGVSADAVENSFVFDEVLVALSVPAKVIRFFGHLATYIGGDISRASNACSVETYDITGHLDGSPHGSPTSITAFSLVGAAAANALPRQVSVTLSYHALYGTTLEHGPSLEIPSAESAIDQGAPATHAGRTRPKASLRGRLYIGPLNLSAMDTSTGGFLSSSFVSALEAAAVELMDGDWSVWSRRTASVHSITGGWIDAQFAVQRKRRVRTATPVTWA